MTTRPRIILADDHALVADALAHLLGESCDLVDVLHDGNELVASARRHRPDVILADLAMPGMSGLDVLRRLRGEGVMTPFLFLTMYAEAALAAEALRAGASGFLLKNSAGEELPLAIADALRGHVYLTPIFAKEVLAALSHPSRPTVGQLTTRQRDVLRLVVQGRSMKQIAAAMDLSPRTVETHKYEMMHALGVETTAELIRFGLEAGVTAPHAPGISPPMIGTL